MQYKKMLITGCLLTVSFFLHAQVLYHLTNEKSAPGSGENFDALFVKNPSGLGFVRLIAKSPGSGSDVVVNLNIQEMPFLTASGEADTNFVKYKILSSEILSGDESAVFPIPVFWFRRSAAGFFEPWAYTTSSESAPPDQSNFSKSEFLDADNLMQNTLLPFFPNGDPIFQNLFSNTHRELSPDEKKTKVFLILVANSDEPTIGDACLADIISVEQVFSKAAQTLGILKQSFRISGSDFNKQNVMAAVSSLKPGPNDVVVFYYSGHGFRKNSDRRAYPYMDLRAKESQDFMTESMNIKDIYDQLKQKGARLTLVVSDCCNTAPEVVNAQLEGMAHNRYSGLKLSQDNCRKLLLDDDRNAWLMCSASQNEKAASNNQLGGFFTNFFVNSLESAMSVTSVNPDWIQVLKTAKEATMVTAANTYCEKPHIPQNLCKQTPLFFPALSAN